MSDVTRNPRQALPSGTTTSYYNGLSTSDTYVVPNDERVLLHFKKTGAGACTVTIQTPKTVGGLAVAEQTVTVPATTGDVVVGPFPANLFNDGSGQLKFTLSDVVGLSFEVFRV